jgi:hypothetical protein
MSCDMRVRNYLGKKQLHACLSLTNHFSFLFLDIDGFNPCVACIWLSRSCLYYFPYSRFMRFSITNPLYEGADLLFISMKSMIL